MQNEIGVRHNPHRMDIWLARVNREEWSYMRNGTIPVIVVSNDTANSLGDLVTVVPATTKQRRLDLPMHVWLSHENNPSLDRGMTMLGEQITTIDRRSLIRQLGRVTNENDIEKVELAVLEQLGFEVE